MSTPYDDAFYVTQRDGSRRSAAKVVPIILELLRPKSVVDVGCGVGTWLAEFAARGVDDVLGIDGEYVNPAMLQIPRDRFAARDLSQPLSVNRRFDLAISLEVAEHLPRASADNFISSLVALAPAVLFSAAIPYQGGNSHLNEQWQDYWAARFRTHGFLPVDCVRPTVWRDASVAMHYAQNTILYVAREHIASRPELDLLARAASGSLSIVHPLSYIGLYHHFAPNNISVRSAARQLLYSLKRATQRRLQGSERRAEGYETAVRAFFSGGHNEA